MSNVPGVAPFSATKSLLEIGQFNKTNAERRAINAETNNFLEMKRSRQAKEKAENALSVQESGMKQDVNKDRIAEDRHRTGARAADKAAEAKSKADEVGSESDMAFDILSDINSEEDHTRAYFRMQGMDVPHDEIIGVIGETYEPGQIAGNLDAIRYRREDQGKLAEVAAKDRATDAGTATAQMRTAADLHIADLRFQGDLARAHAAQASGDSPHVITPGDFPATTYENFLMGAMQALGETKRDNDKAVVAAYTADANYKQLMGAAIHNWNTKTLLAQEGKGQMPPESENPYTMAAGLKRQAIRDASGQGRAVPAFKKLEGNPTSLIEFNKALQDPASVESRMLNAWQGTPRGLYDYIRIQEAATNGGN